ncbi:hypothetical protein BPOR_0053g00130 [Botrytis porri]|uniref:Uncharacterized protein n=1 Tax=Botrytis porri TaxID=87229 RepID=A0A4Z1L1L5_9HELO|nr:hypothetical protein BPOR_0053g00130 [Botrytis porri]
MCLNRYMHCYYGPDPALNVPPPTIPEPLAKHYLPDSTSIMQETSYPNSRAIAHDTNQQRRKNHVTKTIFDLGR